jgi:predicted MPP superfamily phosphohydrolase
MRFGKTSSRKRRSLINCGMRIPFHRILRPGGRHSQQPVLRRAVYGCQDKWERAASIKTTPCIIPVSALDAHIRERENRSMLTRRRLLKGLAQMAAGGAALAAYSSAVEAGMRLTVTRYKISHSQWPAGFRLTLTILADLHACEPWMSAARIRSIAATANGLEADLILLLGDYVTSQRIARTPLPDSVWAEALSVLRAPLGVHAILGNHDWWQDEAAQARGAGPVLAGEALKSAGIPVYENKAARLAKDGRPFWLLGLGDQLALLPGKAWGRKRMKRMDDLPGTLSQVTDGAPVILMAHEPDIFPHVPANVALTLCGHTHGGQIRLFGYSPVVPSRFGNRYAYGHVTEDDPGGGAKRHLLVSGGLGCSFLPARFGVPPEIVHVEISA